MPLEQYRPLQKTEIDHKYPGLKGAVNRVSKVVVEAFRPFRPDVDRFRPPLLLCDTVTLKREMDIAQRKSTREDKPEERGKLQLEAISGVVLGSDGDFANMLAAGPKGFQFLTAIMAEEYVHALSTFGSETSTRVGFLNIPHPRNLHSLIPGKIYEHDLQPNDPNAPLVIEDPREIRLTENITHLAVNLMLNKLLPDAGRKFNYICLSNLDLDPVIITIKDSLLRSAIHSLVVGDEKILEVNSVALQALDTPGTGIYAFSKFPPTVDDLYKYSASPI